MMVDQLKDSLHIHYIKLKIYKLIHLYLYYSEYITVLAKCSIRDPGIEYRVNPQFRDWKKKTSRDCKH